MSEARARQAYEDELIQSARRGDLQAFNRLVEIYQDAVFHTAYRILDNSDAAADSAQEAFISAFNHLGAYRGGSFKAWLLRITTNACYDFLRARKRRPAQSLDDMLETGEDREPMEFVDSREGPEAHAERAELNRTLQAGLSRLPEDQRVIVVLADIQGLSYQEIAAATGANLGTVKSRLNRARLHLREWLLERQEQLPEQYRLSGKQL